MSISSLRSLLYGAGKALGHMQALEQAAKQNSVKPLVKRATRVGLGKGSSRGISALMRGIFK